jgi:membrane glycosyltransferase
MPASPATIFVADRLDRRRVVKRRFFFFTTIFLLTSLATWFMADLLWNSGVSPGRMSPIEWVVLALFVVLFAHVATGFTHALFGFYVLNRGGDRRCIQRTLPPDDPRRPARARPPSSCRYATRTPARVEGLRVIYRSLEETGKLGNFDFFILSDTPIPTNGFGGGSPGSSSASRWAASAASFYRKRRQGINKKTQRGRLPSPLGQQVPLFCRTRC